jgi:hypothetical protein
LEAESDGVPFAHDLLVRALELVDSSLQVFGRGRHRSGGEGVCGEGAVPGGGTWMLGGERGVSVAGYVEGCGGIQSG